jgi:hypothetical protein
MIVTRFTIQACCGTTAIIFKTDCPLSKTHLESLKSLGWIEATRFTQAGILYVDNPDFNMSGPFGTDRLTVKCKHKQAECIQKLNDLEVLLQRVG